MAITRVYQSGFELNDYVAEGVLAVADDAYNIVSSDSPNTGIYSLRCYNAGKFTVPIPATQQIRTGFYIKHNGPRSDGYEFPLFGIVLSNSYILAVVITPAGMLSLKRATTELATGGPGPAIGVQTHIGMDVNTTSGSKWFYVYVDGVLQLSYNAGYDYNIVGVTFGNLLDSIVRQPKAYMYVDDLYIDDTTGESAAPPPNLRFPWLPVNGAGSYAGWTPSAGANYECVDEIPPDDDTTYVSTNAADIVDGYTLAGYTLPSNAVINAVIPTAVALKGDATIATQIALGLRAAGVDAYGSDLDLPVAYASRFSRHTTKPGGGAWAEGDVNATEVLLKSAGVYV